MPPDTPRPSTPGCWTCKVRRKKCDQSVPVCRDCASLQLDCHYSRVKPGWMDGGARQVRMAGRLKAQVKLNTARRVRRGKMARGCAREVAGLVEEQEEDAEDGEDGEGDGEQGTRPRGSSTAHISIPTPTDTLSSAASPAAFFSAVSPCSPTYQTPSLPPPAPSPSPSSFEPSLLASFLDYAFPLLFPFYHPSVFEGGRAWLLTLALQSPAFYHNVVGLAAFFYCAVPVLPGPMGEGGEDVCADKAQAELGVHMQRAVQGVRGGLAGGVLGLQDGVGVLGCVVQLVGFEVAFARDGEWEVHLGGAVGVFEGLVERFGGRGEGEGDEVTAVLSVMLGKLRGGVPSNCSVWAPEQAALRFFTAILVHYDVMASTTHQTAPRLLTHHDGLLVGPSPLSPSSDLLDLQDFTGCPNWVLRAIGLTSSLDAWKTQAKISGTLDFFDLMHRAAPIQQSLREGYSSLTNTSSPSPTPRTQTSPYQPLESLLAKSNISPASSSPSHTAARIAIATVWALAADVYLTTVLSGWQPANVQLRSCVARALDLLLGTENPAWLRSLSWPFCVLGCLAAGEQEEGFRRVARAAGGLGAFGTLRDAVRIMEGVWVGGGEGGSRGDEWSVARWMGMLGHRVLLV